VLLQAHPYVLVTQYKEKKKIKYLRGQSYKEEIILKKREEN
jgi:hypothetical protein